MVKANELRIGNLMQDAKTGTMLWVSELMQEFGSFDFKIYYYVIDRNKFPLHDGWQGVPIPLTPEILEMCGFEKEGLQCDLTNNKMDLDIYDEGYFLCFQGSQRIGIPIKYLHQLQNLFFSLTGEELTIKNLPAST